MAETTFVTPAGQTIDRELLVAYLNVGTALSPEWAPMGVRVDNSNMSYDMGKDTKTDILGRTYTTMKKPTITQSFDSLPITADDKAAKWVWQRGIREQDVQALSAADVLVAHYYEGSEESHFAERYDSCAISVSDFGGDGGGTLTMSSEVTFGGNRTTGHVAKKGETVTFTADAA